MAYLKEEPGSEVVSEVLVAGAHMSAVNWAEVLTKFADQGRSPAEVSDTLEELGILGIGLQIEPVDAALAESIAQFRAPTRQAGLSLGDRACLALGAHLGLPILTADRVWAELGLDLEITAIR